MRIQHFNVSLFFLFLSSLFKLTFLSKQTRTRTHAHGRYVTIYARSNATYIAAHGCFVCNDLIRRIVWSFFGMKIVATQQTPVHSSALHWKWSKLWQQTGYTEFEILIFSYYTHTHFPCCSLSRVSFKSFKCLYRSRSRNSRQRSRAYEKYN